MISEVKTKIGDVVREKATGKLCRIEYMREVCVNHHKGDYETEFFVLFKGQKQCALPFMRRDLDPVSAVDALTFVEP